MREHDFSKLLVIEDPTKRIRRTGIEGLVTEWSILETWSNSGAASSLSVSDCLAEEKTAFCTPEENSGTLWRMLRETPLVCLVENEDVTGVIVKADLIAIVAASGTCRSAENPETL